MTKRSSDDNQLVLFDVRPTDEITQPVQKLDNSSPQTTETDEIKHDTDDVQFQRDARRVIEIARETGLFFYGLIVHDNIHTLASIDRRKNLRLQEVFLKANDNILRSLFRIIGKHKRRGDDERVNRFIAENPPHEIIDGIPVTLLTDCYGPFGKHHNLREILDRIMNKYTGYVDKIHITWRKQSVGLKSVTWGTYRDIGDGGLIRINSLLDESAVPEYVVESVVYHELLHHLTPTETDGTQRKVHTGRFKELITQYPHLKKADTWKRNYFKKLSE
ncbi:MAG: hypothetical protein ABIG42_07335 [bacterium]